MNIMNNNTFEYMSVCVENNDNKGFTDLIMEYSRDGWELLRFNGKSGIMRRQE